jgi:phage terminase large subunit-like protein
MNLAGVNLAALTDDEKRELYELLRLRDIRAKRNRLAAYKPYAKQQAFHDAGSEYRERLFMAGNQLGKCRLSTSLIPLPDGRVATMGELWEAGKPFEVWSWDGEQVVRAPVSHLIRKPAEECVRVYLADGTTFEAALGHQILTHAGYSMLEQLLACVPYLPLNGSGCAPSVHVLGDPHLTQRSPGSHANCSEGFRPCDAPLHADEVVVLELSTSLAGAQPRSLGASPLDDLCLSRRTNTPQSALDLPSNLGARVLAWGRSAAFLARAAYRRVRLQTGKRQIVQPLLAASASLLRSLVAVLPGQGLRNVRALVSPISEGNQIIAYMPIGRHELYDMTVPEFSNYIADGLVHHNTWAGAYELAMHVTGRYPDWWTGRRFPYANRWMVGSESAELTRKGIQRLLVGPPELRDEWGTGTIPHDALRDTSMKQGVPDAVSSVVVRHECGEDSVIQFNSYDQGRTKWQADTVDGVWFDEEPPLPIYSEGLTRTNATGGMVFVTFTPLLGMSDVVKRFLLDKPDGTHVTTMTIEDAEHYTAQERAAIIASYPEHEREARAKGIPIMGSGRVFPIVEDGIKVAPFPIPPHWPRIVGLDFGIDHPTAAVWLAWDRDADVLYVTDTYRVKDQSILIHAASIKARGDWVPVAWPHDGLQRDKGSGDQLMQQYKAHGLNMLKDRATFDDGTNGLEAGLADMLTRMQTQRLRVFSHLSDWFEEFRLYHRKDGLVVKLTDDLMSATRYALMMRRFAKTQEEAEVRIRSVRSAPVVPFGVFDPITGY